MTFKVFIIFTLYWILSAVFVIIIPLTDQPDFWIQWHRAVTSEGVFFNVGYLFERFEYFKDLENCNYESGSYSFFSQIDDECLKLGLITLWDRWYSTFLASLLGLTGCLFYICTKINWIYFKLFMPQHVMHRLSAFLYTLILPAPIYLLGLISVELICQWLLLLTFLFQSYFFWIPTLIFVYYQDEGLFIIFTLFMAVRFVLQRVKLTIYNLERLVFLFFLLSLFTTRVLIPDQVFNSGWEKFDNVFNVIIERGMFSDWLHLIKPLVPPMSLIFMTSSGIKPVFSYIFILFLLILFFSRFNLRQKCTTETQSGVYGKPFYLDFIACVAVIIIFPIWVPSHGFGKYYLFTLPYFMMFFVSIASHKRVFYCALSTTVVTVFNIFLYYL